jgi:hypothetical protein
MLREDLMSSVIEVLWLQVHLAHLKPFLLGCYYSNRPPSANSQYLNNVCEMLDSVCDVNREVYFLGDLNIDWFSSSCQLKRKLLTSACNLVQVINQPTRGLQTLQEQDHPHVSITFLLILQNFVLKLYPYPGDAVITI